MDLDDVNASLADGILDEREKIEREIWRLIHEFESRFGARVTAVEIDRSKHAPGNHPRNLVMLTVDL